MGTLGDIAKADIYLATGLTTAVLLAQAIFLFLTKPAVRLVFPALGLLNTHLLYIIFSSDIGLMSWYAQIGICAAIAVLYWVVLDIVLRAGRMQRWLAIGVPGLVALFVGISSWGALMEDDAPAADVPNNIRTVQFKTKPNIYFLSFDTMIPESLARKILDVPTPPYVDVLNKHGAQLIPNMFSDFVPTKFSLSHVLALDPVAHREIIAKGRGSRHSESIVTGRRPGALHHILKANGYTTHFTFSTGYFGPVKGPYLNKYNIHNPHSACTFLVGPAKTYGFFGYCPIKESETFKSILAAARTNTGQPAGDPFLDYAFDLVRTVANAKNSGPQFYMQHVLHPAHAPNNYKGTPEEREKYRASFQTRSIIAAQAMDRMLTEIRSSDPSAIIFLYGDHGPLTSRPIKFEENKQFYVQDRHGILGAVINAESCEPYLSPPEGERFQTNARIVAGLVQCLAGGESPFVGNVDFSVLHQINPEERYEDYVYE